MRIPRWSGEERPIGLYRYRILWFRVLFVAGVALAFGGGYLVGDHEPAVPSSAQPDATQGETSEQHACAQGSTLRGSDQEDGEASGCFGTLCEFEEPGVPISAAERALLLDEAVARNSALRSRRAALAAEAQATQAYLDSRRVSLDFSKTGFVEALRYLAEVTDLDYGISASARDLVDNERLVVSLRVKDVSVHNALNLILSCNDALRLRVRGGSVWIHSSEDPEEQTTAIYRVEDLVDGSARRLGGHEVDGELLIDLLCEELPDHDGYLEFTNGVLIARLPPSQQARVRALIDRLRSGTRTSAQRPAWIAALEQAMATQRVSLNFVDAPLREVVRDLQVRTGLNLVIGSDVDADLCNVSLRSRELSLEAALSLIVEQTDLSLRLSHETIVIDDCSHGDRDVSLEVFEIRDLSTWLDHDLVEELVYESLGEEQWDGPTSMQTYRGQLFVFQSLAQHEAVLDTLAQLRVSYAEGAADLRR
ncbi:MAG: hypothetical protein KDD82_13445 [Planctomycetes bacterium]|nr:hypothetical protein [Planctomycetota bacterium]